MPVVASLLLAALSASSAAAPVTRYTLAVGLDPAAHRVTIDGTVERPSSKPATIHDVKTIDHPIAKEGEDYARGFAETEGTIQADGVFLSGTSKWYPAPADGALVTFDLTVTLPAGWDAISQGRREVLERGSARTRVRFVASDPQ